MVQRVVDPVQGLRSIGAYRGGIPPGTFEHLFVFDEATNNVMHPWIAESWKVSPDGMKSTIKLKPGIKWQTPIGLRQEYPNGFGEVEAKDIVWWQNQANAALNPKSTDPDGGDYAAVFGQARELDRLTFEIDHITPLYFAVPLSEFGALGAHGFYESKNVFDQLGQEKMFKFRVGTGPYVQGEWIDNNRGTVEAILDHWFYPNDRIAKFTVVQVPENSSRVAMLKSGEADLGVLDFKLVPGLIKEGLQFLTTMKGAYIGISVGYSGNLWESVSARDGSPLEPWKSPAYEKDYPWIGNPWGDRVPYGADKDNPSGMSDMEQARLVRWALAYAIDRDGLVKVLTGGMATPIYSEYIGPEYPAWDPNRTFTKAEVEASMQKWGIITDPTYQVASPLANEQWPWKVPYDPKKAQEFLKLAGYPNGFDITLNVYSAEVGDVSLEIGDNITATWTAIGVKTVQSREDYGAVISQRMRKREQAIPVLKNGDVNSNVWPADWPFPPVDSSLSRPGWGMGFESPMLAEMHKKIRAEPDKAKRTAGQRDTIDWMMYWQLYNGILQTPKGVVATNRIKSWQGRQDHYGLLPPPVSNPAVIVLNK
jgi:ABC-type transport system substrate-binding protein